jgi:hypothetical protein
LLPHLPASDEQVLCFLHKTSIVNSIGSETDDHFDLSKKVIFFQQIASYVCHG